MVHTQTGDDVIHDGDGIKQGWNEMVQSWKGMELWDGITI